MAIRATNGSLPAARADIIINLSAARTAEIEITEESCHSGSCDIIGQTSKIDIRSYGHCEVDGFRTPCYG